MENSYLEEIKKLFHDWSGEKVRKLEPLPKSGSYREYYRIHGERTTAVGTYNADLKENKAFLTFTKHFFKLGIPVPEVLAEGSGGTTYLLTDLGDETIFDLLKKRRKKTGVFPGTVIRLYKNALEKLPEIQILGSADLDYSVCYPRSAFDRQSMMWDLNYFKYYFLKLAKIPFDEQALENDFQTLCDYLLKADDGYFLYRDFQSRNIMVKEKDLFFIDYQGGRRGALQYDVASLLFDSKANIPFEVKNVLFDHYLQVLKGFIKFDEAQFTDQYKGFVLIRLMQAMGAYGFRGFYERRTQFLQSIPFALRQMNYIVKNFRVPLELTQLWGVLESLQESPELQKYSREFRTTKPLKIEINSFSYHKGIPENSKGHGGGFVFDCRCIHNPGRYERFSNLSGKDPAVTEFLKKGGEADAFLFQISQIVEQAVDKYLSRGFSDLQVSFGCTGGQHRSVYCAEELGRHLYEKYPDQVQISINHQHKQ